MAVRELMPSHSVGCLKRCVDPHKDLSSLVMSKDFYGCLVNLYDNLPRLWSISFEIILSLDGS